MWTQTEKPMMELVNPLSFHLEILYDLPDWLPVEELVDDADDIPAGSRTHWIVLF